MLRSRFEAAFRMFVATLCQRRSVSTPAESVAGSWDADPRLPGSKLSMLLLDALCQSDTCDTALPEQKFLCQLLYHKIKSTGMSITDFTADNKEARILATALDMYKPGDIFASTFADSAKHALAKVIADYSPNYIHDPAVHFASDSDSDGADDGLPPATTIDTPTSQQQSSAKARFGAEISNLADEVVAELAQLCVDTVVRLVAFHFTMAYDELTLAMVTKLCRIGQ